jgi:dTDP-glucose pyrophosphorylase
MKVVVTMAGEGSRFKDAGVDEEKYRLVVRDRTMFEWAMRSLSAFFDEEFVFVTRASHDARPFLDAKCEALGIDRFEVVELDHLTSGQATTAIEADPHVDDDDAAVVYNIDTYVEEGHLSPEALTGDGCIPVFEADGGSWSFVALGDDGTAVEVAEKEPISTLASLGLYHFARWADFRTAFEAAGTRVEDDYGERYVAPMYNDLIDRGLDVTVSRVPRSAVHILGTPDDVRAFDPGFDARYGLD